MYFFLYYYAHGVYVAICGLIGIARLLRRKKNDDGET